jgi:hypothetical protein
MVQQGQVFQLASRNCQARWAYRYRVGGRGSRRNVVASHRSRRNRGHSTGRCHSLIGQGRDLTSSTTGSQTR